jgi:superfamily I DNA/RNA helicase
MELFPDYMRFAGPEPEILQYPDIGQVVDYVSEELSNLIANGEYPMSEIAVLYATSDISDEYQIEKRIMRSLSAKGIMTRWSSENYAAKRNYDITTDSVTISTIHSVKGLDYSCVFLVGLDYLDQNRWTKKQSECLAYVAFTRARHRLYIPYTDPEHFLIRKLLACSNKLSQEESHEELDTSSNREYN